MIVKGHIYIPEKKFSLDVRENLVFRNPIYDRKIRNGEDTSGISPYFVLHKKVKLGNKYYYKVPRYVFGNFSNLPNVKLRLNDVPAKIPIKKKITINGKEVELNSSQKNSINNLVQTLKKEYAAVLNAKTGEGKTLMAVFVISAMSQKTVILVQKNSMIKQWIEAITTYTSLQEKNIGLLQQGKFIDGPIVIASQQSLMNKTFDKSINNLFGMKVQDETHKIGAKKFLRANTRFNTKYNLSLSATLKRPDHLEELYMLHTSKNVIKHKNVRTLTAKYKVYEFISGNKWKRYPMFIPFKVQLINNLINDEGRNNSIIDILSRHSKRHILVLSERISHLKILMEKAQKEFPDKNIMRFFGAEVKFKRKKVCSFNMKKGVNGNITVLKISRDRTVLNSVVINGRGYTDISAEDVYFNNKTAYKELRKFVKRDWKKIKNVVDSYEDPDLKDLNNADIIFATFTKAKDAIDIPNIDTILIATPFGSSITLIQSKGRAERYVEGKKHPLVIDILDSKYKLAKGLFVSRKKVYEENKMIEIIPNFRLIKGKPNKK